MNNFILTNEIKNILNDLNNGHSVYITGCAGTGKSYLIDYFISCNPEKNIVKLAPTGIAASHINGATLHSFFKLPVTLETLSIADADLHRDKTIFKHIDAIIIDEMSMVRADIFDLINRILCANRKKYKDKPFGGIQMILIGDHYQLPPVLKYKDKPVFEKFYKYPYFFGAKIFKVLNKFMKYHRLTKVFRQEDAEYIDFLYKTRKGVVDYDFANKIQIQSKDDIDFEKTTFLTSTNEVVNYINETLLDELTTTEKIYYAQGKVSEQYNVPIELRLRIGAKVIFCKNDSEKQWVNGSIGMVVNFVENPDEDIIEVQLDNGQVVDVHTEIFCQHYYNYNRETKTIEILQKDSMTQYPLRLAYALTIHKSQGQTLKNVYIDLTTLPFIHGQMYVALSRCTSLNGLSISKSLTNKMIIVDNVVNVFDDFINQKISEQNKLVFVDEEKIG